MNKISTLTYNQVATIILKKKRSKSEIVVDLKKMFFS